jgi:hypothetical protein
VFNARQGVYYTSTVLERYNIPAEASLSLPPSITASSASLSTPSAQNLPQTPQPRPTRNAPQAGSATMLHITQQGLLQRALGHTRIVQVTETAAHARRAACITSISAAPGGSRTQAGQLGTVFWAQWSWSFGDRGLGLRLLLG